jgi:hypothetical protein
MFWIWLACPAYSAGVIFKKQLQMILDIAGA